MTGYAALHVAAYASVNAQNTTRIDCEGQIGSTGINPPDIAGGRGVQLDACNGCSFKMTGNASADYNLIVGQITLNPTGDVCTSPKQVAPIVYDGNAQETTLTTCLDPFSLGLVNYPVRQFFASGNAVNAPSSPLSDLVSNVINTVGVTFSVTGNFSVNMRAPLWIIERSGPTAAFADSWDTASHMYNAISATGPVQVGQIYRARVCNRTTYNETVADNTGETGGTVAVAPGACASFVMTFTNISTPTMVINGG